MHMSVARKVAVIGAGASGIGAVGQFIERGFRVTVFESRDEIGGTWLYEGNPAPLQVSYDGEGRPIALSKFEREGGRGIGNTPIYDGLWTNIPIDLMTFRDFPAPKDSSLFPDFKTVHTYLRNYSTRILSHPQVNLRLLRTVTDVRWSPASTGERRWTVESVGTDLDCPGLQMNQDGRKNGETRDRSGEGGAGAGDEKEREEFDFVCIANGHYTVPYIPYIPGLWNFKGKITHARAYRRPEDFKDDVVLLVGNYASGSDIAREIAEYHHEHQTSILPKPPTINGSAPATAAESPKPKLYQSIRSSNPLSTIDLDSPNRPPWAKQITGVPEISKIQTDGTIVFVDGTELPDGVVGTIIFATGYLYSFPFAKLGSPFVERPLTRSPPVSPPPEPSKPRSREFSVTGSGSVEGDVGTPSKEQVDVAYPDGGFRTHNVDKRFHTFYLPDPTLSFLGLNQMIIPFPFAQTQARAISALWSQQVSPSSFDLPFETIPLGPHPSDSSPASELPREDDSESGENKKYHSLGFPRDFDHSDSLLRVIGEGDPVGVGEEGAGGGGWGLLEEWRVERRKNAKVLKAQFLGH